MTSQRRIIFIIFSFVILQISLYAIYKYNNIVQIIETPLTENGQLEESEAINDSLFNKEINVQTDLIPSSGESKYRLGFQQLKDELILKNLPVQGEVPSWLYGTLIFNGPAYQIDKTSWFDGLAMLHSFKFENSKVDYRNRFIQSKEYFDIFKDKKPKIKNNKLNNANVNITKLNGKIVALSEIPLPVIIDPETLETIASFKYNDKLPTDKIFESCNPIRDENKKETFNFLIHMGVMSSNYEIYKIVDGIHSLGLGDAKREKVATITISEPAYIHGFSLTENYVILVEYPFIVKPYKLALAGAPIDKFEWKPANGTNFYIVDRNTKNVTKINTKAFFSVHHVNAFEENGQIIVDIVTFESSKVIKKMTGLASRLGLKEYDPEVFSKLTRFKIDMVNKIIEDKLLTKDLIAFPAINKNFRMKPYNFVYGISILFKDYYDDLNQLIKISINDSIAKFWHEDGCYPYQPIFVANPSVSDEDDGVVMSVVLDGKKNSSFLLILDAKSFNEVARIELPHIVPFGLHGNFFSL